MSLGPALHCDWGITRYQQALTTTIVFLGMMLSSTFWGQLSDRYGRKPVTSFISWFIARNIYVTLSTGFDFVWRVAISVWSFKFGRSKFWMASIFKRPGWLCYWMCTSVVSLSRLKNLVTQMTILTQL